jgi:hypothetical protein
LSGGAHPQLGVSPRGAISLTDSFFFFDAGHGAEELAGAHDREGRARGDAGGGAAADGDAGAAAEEAGGEGTQVDRGAEREMTGEGLVVLARTATTTTYGSGSARCAAGM